MNQHHRPPEVRGRTPRTPRTPRTATRTARKTVVLGLALAIPLVAAPAMAEIVPVAPPHHIEVFPSIDMAGAHGFTEPFVLEVWRNGVRVGTSGDPSDTDLLELNHDGPPCWSGVTPDIIAGDQIRMTTAESLDSVDPLGEYMTVADLDADPARLVALDADGLANDLVMTGTATTLDGTAALPLANLGAEIVQPAWRDHGWSRRAMGAVAGGQLPGADTVHPDGGDGVLSYDPVSETNPLGNHWTAIWKNMPEPHGSLALEGEQMISSFERDDGAEGSGLTITDAEDASGPGVGCPAAAADAVTSTSPTSANIAFMGGVSDMVVSGTSYNAAGGQITLDDVDGNAADAIMVPAVIDAPAATGDTTEPVAPVRQTWTASFPRGAFDGLADGDLRVSATFDRVVESEVVSDPDPTTGETTTTYAHTTTPMPGRVHTLLKDSVAPLAPTAFPHSGRYASTQSVTISADDEIGETVRYRVGAAAATTPEPTVGSPTVGGPIEVSTSQTIKARSFDRAGNPSTATVLDYQIVPLAAPGDPQDVTATAGSGRPPCPGRPPPTTAARPSRAGTSRSTRTAPSCGSSRSRRPVRGPSSSATSPRARRTASSSRPSTPRASARRPRSPRRSRRRLPRTPPGPR